jgi:hypothetical protein
MTDQLEVALHYVIYVCVAIVVSASVYIGITLACALWKLIRESRT